MSTKLPPTASVATALDGEKLHAPAAARNAGVLCDLLCARAPQSGRALEIASGTGQHVVSFAGAMPGLTWHPTEIDSARIASINAYIAQSSATNLEPAQHLDATRDGWSKDATDCDLVVLINLLHLIRKDQSVVLINEAMAALRTGGRFVIYGPFKRNGKLTSDGDARFNDQLVQANPSIGYKNDADIMAWLEAAGASNTSMVDMPANNLAFIATR